MAPETDDDGGSSARKRRWDSLNVLTELLSDGKVQLEDLVSQLENPNPVLPHGFLRKRKRSPRTNNKNNPQAIVTVDLDHAHHPISAPKTPIKIKIKNIVVSRQITTECSGSDLHEIRKPNLARSTKKGYNFETGESSSSTKNAEGSRNSHITDSLIVEQPALPEEFKNRIVEIGGCLESVVFVIEKVLTTTDVDKGQSRLSLPYQKVKDIVFLRPDEKTELKGGIRVALIQPSLGICWMTFKHWASNSMYVFNNGWNDVCGGNGLVKETRIRLWSFRRNSELCFVLMRVN